MKKSVAAVIIPIYKTQPDKNEALSMNQCFRILNSYHIIFIAPKALDTKFYHQTCKEHGVSFNEIKFADHYFTGIAGYNQLMLSPTFYKTFRQYKYILICQLDAYVFKDELDYWCGRGYDFIGAPALPHQNLPSEVQFLTGYSKIVALFNKLLGTKHQISNVGNGGFSLRNTRNCYYLLKLLQSQVKTWGPNNEDGFFKYWGNIFHPLFKLPPDHEALHFSIELSPSESLKKLNGTLPFGCHAFEKHEPQTWQRYIKGFDDCDDQSQHKN